MKLVALMCVEEYVEDARKLLHDERIQAYSEAPMKGYRISDDDESDNWFAAKHLLTNSHIFFSMCDNETADRFMKAIKKCSLTKEKNSVHAFQVDIEKFIG